MIIYLSQNADLGIFGDSIDEWVNIKAHLILFVFLPALLFGEAMNLNWHQVKGGFLQVKSIHLIVKPLINTFS